MMARFQTLVEALRTGRLSTSQLLERALLKNKKLNPYLRATVCLYPEKELQKTANNCQGAGGVQGIPILVKEVLNVKGLPTTLSDPELASLCKDTFRAPRATDSDVVATLRSKGALILGKTNIPTRGLDVQTSNSIYGTTCNPWAIELTPGGSSGGSAAAVAAGIVPIALGTDLAGSLRIPAAFCGVSSLRTSWGRVSCRGHVPPVPPGPIGEYTLRVGALTVDCDAQDAFLKAVCKDYNELRALAQPPEKNTMYITPSLPKTPTDSRIVKYLSSTFPSALAEKGYNVHIKDAPPLDYRALMDTYKVFSTAYLGGHNVDQAKMKAAERERHVAMSILSDFLGQDAFWVLPTACTLPYPHNHDHKPIKISGLDKPVSYWQASLTYVTFLTVTSNPVLTLPVGLVDGLPMGVQIVGRIGDDERLVGLGRAIETVFPPVEPSMAWANSLDEKENAPPLAFNQ